MEEKRFTIWTPTVERNEEARGGLEADTRGKAAHNDDDERHTVHSTSQSSSETILEAVHEFSNLSERVFRGGMAGQEPVVASQSNNGTDGSLRAPRVPSSVSSGIEVADAFASSDSEVAATLGPEDSRSFSSGTASAPTRRRQGQRPRRNRKRLPGNRGVGAGSPPNLDPQATRDTGRAGYFSNSVLTPYFSQFQNPTGSPNYWPYGSLPPPHPGLFSDSIIPDDNGVSREYNASRNKVNSPSANRTILTENGSKQRQHSDAGWSLIASPIRKPSTIRSSSPVHHHAAHSKALDVTTANRSAAEEPLLEGLVQSPGYERLSIQSDGLAFSVSVQCSHATLHSRFSTLLHQYWPERTAQNDSGKIWVRKAVSSKRFKQRDGLHSIELACNSGPTPTDTNDYQIQWLYVEQIPETIPENY
jgi:hypothetical protein